MLNQQTSSKEAMPDLAHHNLSQTLRLDSTNLNKIGNIKNTCLKKNSSCKHLNGGISTNFSAALTQINLSKKPANAHKTLSKQTNKTNFIELNKNNVEKFSTN